MHDVAVIGGGINGAGIARDAAGRGAKVLLLEANDLAFGTSSRSTKLIHGGLRYLEHYEFALVREALAEREVLWGIAPHIVWPLRFVLPWVPGLRPRWLLRTGLFLYDHIGGRPRLPATTSLRLPGTPQGEPLQPRYRHAFAYSDAWVDDARMVIANARDAARAGATIRPREGLTVARRDGDHWLLTTAPGQYRARALVNAAGPAVLDVLEMAHARPELAMRLVRGSHIVVPRLYDAPHAYFFQLPDGRIFFAIPYEDAFTLIGTTDVDHPGPAADPQPSADEIAYLCDGASRYFATPVTPADVVHAFAGVRPLIDDGSGRPEAATRGYRLDLSDPAEGAPLLTLYGGKLTSFRHVAEKAVDALATRLPLTARPSGWTARAALPGGDFTDQPSLAAALAADFSYLAPPEVQRLVRTYGTDARHFLPATRAGLGRDFGGGLTEAEVAWLIAEEWAQTADDILWRRTKRGLVLAPEQVAALEKWLEGRR